MIKPHIKKSGAMHICTGRGISVESVTATGAYIAWIRQAALMAICRTEEAMCKHCAEAAETSSAAFSVSEAAHG